MIHWEECLKSNIIEFRRHYTELPKESREALEKRKKLLDYSLLSPCQIVAIKFSDTDFACIVILHIAEHADMEIIIFEDFQSEKLSEIAEEPKLLKLLGKKGTESFVDQVKSNCKDASVDTGLWISRVSPLSQFSFSVTCVRIQMLFSVVTRHFYNQGPA